MKGTVEVLEPEEVEVTVTLTATLGEFKKLRDQMQERWPGWEVARIIQSATDRIEAKLRAPEPPA